MKKFWENANHFVRIIGGVGALAAFALAGLFIAVTLFAVWVYKDHPDWKTVPAILIAGAFAVYGTVVFGLRAWQESKHTICASRGCDKPVASLGDLLCGDCLAKKEQGESAITSEAPQDDSAPTPSKAAATVAVDESSADDGKAPEASAKESAPQCLTCRTPTTRRGDGKYRWWCIKCWRERERKAQEDNTPPQCFADGCDKIVRDVHDPWCRECWEYKKENERDPIVTRKGLRVKSRPERRIAEFLDENGIPFKYDEPLPGKAWRCDFLLSPGGGRRDVYIEYFGWVDMPDYREQMERKTAYYKAKELDLLALLPEKDAEPGDLEKRLERELRNREYQI